MLSKCRKDIFNIKYANALYSPWVTKYNKDEFQKLQNLKETEECLVILKFKLGYVEEQLFVVVFVNSNKNGSFLVDVQLTFMK